MIEIKDLSMSFTNAKVLDNLELTIEDERIYGLIGANGTGKSTLLRILTGIYKNTSGSVLYDGMSVFDNLEIKKNIVYVPDELFFFGSYTLIDTAKYYEALYPYFDMDYVINNANVLKFDLDKPISSMSKGQRRGCALLCAFACNTKYLFFDETFDGIDPVARKHFRRLLSNHILDNKSTIIMTSHNLRELEDLCDNLALLHSGKILFESNIDSIKTDLLKLQISLNTNFNKDTFKPLKIMYYKKSGNIATLIVCNEAKTKDFLESLNPVILDYLPLTIEEVFIYKMEELGYEFK